MTSNSESNQDFERSIFREKMLEHVFLSKLLQLAWLKKGRKRIEILRPEVDDSGYDLLLECGEERRYLQLKSSGIKSSAKSRPQIVNVGLETKAGGCVVQILSCENDESGEIQLKFRFFGDKDPKKCPNLGKEPGTHPITGKENPNKRKIHISKFCKPTGIEELFDILFPGINSGHATALQCE